MPATVSSTHKPKAEPVSDWTVLRRFRAALFIFVGLLFVSAGVVLIFEGVSESDPAVPAKTLKKPQEDRNLGPVLLNIGGGMALLAGFAAMRHGVSITNG